ncbi:MAG: tetratricopeptide repeat protein [Treponema sp.]|nr:tetratricopeptide repeat protein [Treponema sp.]
MNEYTLKGDFRYFITYMLSGFLYLTKPLNLNEKDILYIKKLISLINTLYLSYSSFYSLVEYVEGSKYSKEKYYFNLAVSHYKNNELDLAIDKLTQAIKINPCYELALLKRAIIYLQCFLVSAGLYDTPMLTISLRCIGVPVFQQQRDICNNIELNYFSMAMDDIANAVNFIPENKNKLINENLKVKKQTIYQDEFFIIMKEFIAIHGMEIFNNERFKAHFYDYLNGDYKKDANFLLHAIKNNIHNEILKSTNIKETRKNIIVNLESDSFLTESITFKNDLTHAVRITDILFSLLKPAYQISCDPLTTRKPFTHVASPGT